MADKKRPFLPPTVIALGVISLLTDLSSEMVFPLLPLFLTRDLKAGALFLGIVEGTADTVSSLLKLVSGAFSDRLSRRKPLVVVGYGIPASVRPLIALATAPWHMLAIRVTDRVGKGIRSAPRDALIADAAVEGESGRAFGFHQAMDDAGAVFGPLIATALVAAGIALRPVFLVAAIPGLLAFVVAASLMEPPHEKKVVASSGASASIPGPAKQFFAILLVFSLGNSSDAFLLLQAANRGIPAAAIPLLWSTHNVSRVVSSYGAGWVSDHVPRAWLIVMGWVVFAGTYLGLAHSTSAVQVWPLFIVYGFYYGLADPVSKALVRDLVPAEARGRAFGVFNFITGASALPAGLITGGLWKAFGAQVALSYGAATAGLSAVALVVWQLNRRPATA